MNPEVDVPAVTMDAAVEEALQPLFGQEFDQPLVDTISVDRTLWWLKKIAAEKAAFQAQLDEAVAFYQRKMAQCDQTAEFAKARIETFLKAAQKEKLATPNGTVFFQTTKSVVWPESTTLEAFAREKGVDCITTETVTKIDKATLKKYIVESGQAPMGFEITEKTKLAVRMSKEEA